jgi:transposase-like protein
MPTQYTHKSNRQYLSRAVWEKHVADFHASGLTQPEYAKKHGLVLTTFRNWVRRVIRDRQSLPTESPTFIPVKVNTSTDSLLEEDCHDKPTGELHITLPNGIQCTFPTNHAPKLILPWIEYLRVLP